jgi:hypothetical protein
LLASGRFLKEVLPGSPLQFSAKLTAFEVLPG